MSPRIHTDVAETRAYRSSEEAEALTVMLRATRALETSDHHVQLVRILDSDAVLREFLDALTFYGEADLARGVECIAEDRELRRRLSSNLRWSLQLEEAEVLGTMVSAARALEASSHHAHLALMLGDDDTLEGVLKALVERRELELAKQVQEISEDPVLRGWIVGNLVESRRFQEAA